MTHGELVFLAARWLRKKHIVIVTEMAGTGEEPDAIGWDASGYSTMIECKATKSDFTADGKKRFRRLPEDGLGCRRLYMAPMGLIAIGELPERWGLLEVKGKRITETMLAGKHPEWQQRRELSLLVSAMRREDARCIRKYTYQTKCRASLGIHDRTGGE